MRYDPAVSGAAVQLEPGHVLDERYHLLEEIGRGGMGTVFAAKHLELGETVAVKVLQAKNGFETTMEQEHLERFLREARLASKIKNEHVVRILDVARGKNGSPPYIVMELLEGIDLGQLSRGLGKVPIADAIDYILQACEALAEAHALGIVHRDLKSSNLHRTRHPDGTTTIKVLDFGISKAHDDTLDDAKLDLTSTSAVFGSPAYMSPEQIRSVKHVDHRTDIWALAIVLYELISGGELPFLGDNASAMLAAIAADPPIPLRKFQPETPFELDKAIYDALQKPREKRTQTVAAFAGAIAPFGGPRAKERLAAVLRAAARSSSRSGSLQPPPMVPVPEAVQGTGPISDTMRVSDPALLKPVVSATVPMAPPSHRHEAIGGTDRDMVVPLSPRSSSTSLAAIMGIVGVGLGIVIGGGALFFVMKRETHRERPAPPAPVVIAPPPEAASIPAPVPLTSSEPVEREREREREREAGAAPSVAPKKPKHVPHPNPNPGATPVPSSKGNGMLDTSTRQ